MNKRIVKWAKEYPYYAAFVVILVIAIGASVTKYFAG